MNYKTFVGIDVSKQTLDVAIAEGKHHSQFTNDKKGYKEMMNWLKSQSGYDPCQILICMEHTGIYSYRLSCFLSKEGVHYCMESPLQIKCSMGVIRQKSDKADAHNIARYVKLYHKDLRLHDMPSKILMKLQGLLAHRDRLIRMKQGLSIAYKEFSVHTDKELNALISQDSKSLIKSIEGKIANVDKAMDELVKDHESIKTNYQLATSVKGIGKLTALHMLVYTRNFTAFKEARKFACYAGIAPFEYSSGTSIRGRNKVSQYANKKMKTLLSMAACSAVLSDHEIKGYYGRKLEEGKHKMSVLNAIKNKLIGRVFAAVKRGTPFVPIGNY